MPKSYRIRTEVGKDKSIKLQLDQDFEFLEILSLKLVQNQVYSRLCSDYGVVIGRVSVNDGYGLPNCKVSIFIPLTDADAANPIIADLYPYTSLTSVNEDGYRYNLLPYTKSYSAHKPTGTFFTREDVLTDTNLIEVYDKYYKYTAVTNDSGDFMIFGVPIGTQTIHMDVDLSDMGEFSLNPQDLLRMGLTTEKQLSGVEFKSSTSLDSLPQIVSLNKTIEVEPFWGEQGVCNVGITRIDFDLTTEKNITIEPVALFMGSIMSDSDNLALKRSCKPKFKQGELCSLVAGPGSILAIRQTIYQDNLGYPILESVNLGGDEIDENGTWLLDLPMNLDYVYTNEFGEKVLSNNPKVGIPTKAKYRFKIKWAQSENLSEDTKRAYFLVPNIREYGWNNPQAVDQTLRRKSYAFSLNWNDYANPKAAINCEDTFYLMTYNKVYTVSQMIDQFRRGTLPNRLVSIKNILDETCESEINKYPTNDSFFRNDIIFLVIVFLLSILRLIIIPLLIVIHVIYIILDLLKYILPVFAFNFGYIAAQELYSAAVSAPAWGLALPFFAKFLLYGGLSAAATIVAFKMNDLKLKPINLPVLLYDQCEFCDCSIPDDLDDDSATSDTKNQANQATQNGGVSIIVPPALVQVFSFTNGVYNKDQLVINTNITYINQLLAGAPKNNSLQPPFCYTKTPQMVSTTDAYFFSSSLTIAERINLFNTKAKYFNDSPQNPGGGVNQIKVKFASDLNPAPTSFHTDNVVFLVLNKESLVNLKAGQLLSFQDPNLSKDKNCTGSTLNSFNNNAVLGNNLNNTNITVNFIRPDSTIGQTIYTIPQPSDSDTNYHKFPTDLEYFQVITAMTFNNYSTQCVSSLSASLYDRILDENMRILGIGRNGVIGKNVMQVGSYNPMTTLKDYKDLTVVMLVRGVDPYSSRVKVEYDLSKVFGYSTFGNKIIRGQYKLNIPIQGFSDIPNSVFGFLNVDHQNIISTSDVDPYSNMRLYYDTYNYSPINPSAFTSNLHTYYSSLGNNTFNLTNNTCSCSQISQGATISTQRGLIVSSTNDFTKEWNIPIPTPFGPAFTSSFNTYPSNRFRGYYENEVVEGGSLMIMKANLPLPPSPSDPTVSATYITPKYSSGLTLNHNFSNGGRRIIMRSDRLPISTNVFENCGNYYALQNNDFLGMYTFSDDGYIQPKQDPNQATSNPGSSDNDPVQNFTNKVVDSLNNCKDSVPLECYGFVNNEFVVNSGNCEKSNDKYIYQDGCYKLVTTPLISLINGTDIKIVTEWISRTNVTFGACRNVFSHYFTNNWINGNLYAFAFKNSVTFDFQNRPKSNICTRLIYYDDQTFNFYYRSSPYDSNKNEFIGVSASQNKGNDENILFPTTIMDLGPIKSYTQEIVLNNDYDGYVMGNLKNTTFNNVSDLLNLLIISRLANTNFISLLVGAGGASVLSYFNKRDNRAIDGDYAQMISINSEFGVSEFESDNYPEDPTGQDPVYFNGGNTKDGVIGIFFSSDTQLRDFITPKRTIINDNIAIGNNCSFENFGSFSQDVPFYQWQINKGDPDSIFGSQSNTWYTKSDINGNSFLHKKYQSLDRLENTSRYFRNNMGLAKTKFDKGHIYSVNNSEKLDANPTFIDFNNPQPRAITVGVPFHFYFGLKKGGSAWDRFAQRYIGVNTII